MNKEINEDFIRKEALEAEVSEIKMNDLNFSCILLHGSDNTTQNISSFFEIEDLNENEI
jgi:hypothetical protein